MSRPVIQLTSWELYHLPEFKALCEKIGIPWDFLTLGLKIEIGPDPDMLVLITQSYRLESKVADKPTYVDTTTQHNTEYRAKQPCQHQS